MPFLQNPPKEHDPYRSDPLLQGLLARHAPDCREDVARFSARVLEEVRPAADRCDRHPPELVRYDPWGNRIDRIDTDPAWGHLGGIAAEEGLVGIPYETPGTTARVHQAAKLYLFGARSAIYGCYLAMSDGAASVLERLGQGERHVAALQSLTSRDPETHWTSGQWMTEKAGGSDVGGTETVAAESQDGWHLSGQKWFTSATTSQMALTLARTEDLPGSKGLSLFYVETRDADGRWNGITVERLKDKLGTRALPTAELRLEGSRAEMLGEPGQGVRHIAAMLNITRYHNALNAASYMRRVLDVAQDYAKRREAFGRPIADQPLHQETLLDMEAEWAGALALSFEVARLTGRSEGQGDPGAEALLRLLTPVTKLYTAKQAVAVVSEGLECMGGQGYVEDTGLPRLLRDAQVLPIWEGTTNVLALDAVRALQKTAAWDLAGQALEGYLDAAPDSARDAMQERRTALSSFVQDPQEAGARRFCYDFARRYGGALLMDQAAWAREAGENTDWHRAVADRWAMFGPAPMGGAA